MKTWQERWFEEIDAATPALTEEVKNAPIEKGEIPVSTREEKQTEQNGSKKPFSTKKSRTIGIIAACAAGVIGLSVALPSMFNPYLPPSNTPAVTDSANEAVVVAINPEAVFSVDENGVVQSVVANNADADVILSSQTRVAEMEGESLETAVEVFVDYAAQLGFLDYSVPDAVCISACEEENLSKLNDSLKKYFCEKGAKIAIVPETLTQETLCQRIGVEAQDASSLAKTLESLPELYSRRRAEGKEDADLESLYREAIPVDGMKAYYESALNENIEKIEKNIADLQALSEKAEEIRTHEDNPLALLGGADYWSLKALRQEDEAAAGENGRTDGGEFDWGLGGDWTEEYTEAFALLMTEMEGLLAAYEKEYGVEIDSRRDLEDAANAAVNLPLQKLKELLLEIFR